MAEWENTVFRSHLESQAIIVMPLAVALPPCPMGPQQSLCLQKAAWQRRVWNPHLCRFPECPRTFLVFFFFFQTRFHLILSTCFQAVQVPWRYKISSWSRDPGPGSPRWVCRDAQAFKDRAFLFLMRPCLVVQVGMKRVYVSNSRR